MMERNENCKRNEECKERKEKPNMVRTRAKGKFRIGHEDIVGSGR